MFPDPFPIPVVEVSIDASLNADKLLAVGRALSPLGREGVLILSGGLTIHTYVSRDFRNAGLLTHSSFQEPDAWDPATAEPGFHDFEASVCIALFVACLYISCSGGKGR
jgi:hypothetical protein